MQYYYKTFCWDRMILFQHTICLNLHYGTVNNKLAVWEHLLTPEDLSRIAAIP